MLKWSVSNKSAGETMNHIYQNQDILDSERRRRRYETGTTIQMDENGYVIPRKKTVVGPPPQEQRLLVDSNGGNDDDNNRNTGIDRRRFIKTLRLLTIIAISLLFILFLLLLAKDIFLNIPTKKEVDGGSAFKSNWTHMRWRTEATNTNLNVLQVRHYIDQLSVEAYRHSARIEEYVNHVIERLEDPNHITAQKWFVGVRATVSLADAKLALIDIGRTDILESINAAILRYLVDFNEVKNYGLVGESNAVWTSYAYVVAKYPSVDERVVQYFSQLDPVVRDGSGFYKGGMYVAHQAGRLMTYAKVYISGVTDVLSAMLANTKVSEYFENMKYRTVDLYSKISHRKTICFPSIFHDRGGRYLFAKVFPRVYRDEENIYVLNPGSVVIVNSRFFLYTTVGHSANMYLLEIDSKAFDKASSILTGNRPFFNDMVPYATKYEPMSLPNLIGLKYLHIVGRNRNSFHIASGSDTRSTIVKGDKSVVVVNNITCPNLGPVGYVSVEYITYSSVCKFYVNIFRAAEQKLYVSYSWPVQKNKNKLDLVTSTWHSDSMFEQEPIAEVKSTSGFPGISRVLTFFQAINGSFDDSVIIEDDDLRKRLAVVQVTGDIIKLVGTCIVFDNYEPDINITYIDKDEAEKSGYRFVFDGAYIVYIFPDNQISVNHVVTKHL